MYRAHPPHRAAQGLRPSPAHRGVGRSTSRTRRGRCSSTSRTGAGATRCSPRSKCPRDWLPPVHESTEIAGAGDQQAAALGVGVDRAGRRLGRPRHFRRRLRRAARIRPRLQARRARVLPRRARHLGGDGSDAQRRGLVALAPRRSRAGHRVRGADRGGRPLAPGSGGPDLPSLPPGRADAACGSGRARRVHRPLAPPRPWRAGPRRARGRRLRLARLARAAARARRRAREGPRVGRRRAQPPLARDRRLGARPAARAHRRRGGIGVRRGNARRRCGRRLRGRRRGGHGLRTSRARRSSRTPLWASAYDEGYARFRALYPALRTGEER